ncbi:LamG-like jellyroll fold domain-containing protein [Rurimicrobium arvi]|uniref:LamG-like jellyroll fold domain-containing protein n=1 Tax=Rurimicrobium arvi TaxID=2049916 RepID=A0ABP8MZM9_9BACT
MGLRFTCKTALISAVVVLGASYAKAQKVSGDGFLKGQYVEVGIAPNGCFGSQYGAPLGFHGRSLATYSPAAAIGFVADPDKDGWTTGIPTYVGDYFMPASEYQSWAIEINGTVYTMNRYTASSAGGTTFPAGVTGAVDTYYVAGREKHIIWKGTIGALSITKDIYIDTTSLYFVEKVKVKNTGATALNGIYFGQGVNPDNDAGATGDLNTADTVVYQTPNTANRSLVSARGNSGAYLGLGSKDCRAKVFRFNFSATSPFITSTLLSGIYAGDGSNGHYFSGGASGQNNFIGVVFNLGNLAAGDSTTCSYAYILRQPDLDSALNNIKPNFAQGSNKYKNGDTVSVCAGSTLSMTIENGGAYAYTFPAGLASGSAYSFSLIARADSTVTYSFVGTPLSATCSLNDTITLTVKPLAIPLTMVDTSSPEICAGQSVTLTAASGTKGNALDFSGAYGYYGSVPNSSDISLSGSSAFTVEAWVYPRENKHQNILFHSLGCSSWHNWTMGIGGFEAGNEWTPKKWWFSFLTGNGSGVNYVASADTVVTNQWAHIAVTYDGSNLKLYVNGVLNATRAASGVPWNSTEKLYFGFDPGCGGRVPMNGKLDEVRIWNKTRSASEISGTYKNVIDPGSANLKAYWRFDENNGKYFYDLTAGNNHGTLTNTVGREKPSTAPMIAATSGTITYAWSPATGLTPATGSPVVANPSATTTYTLTSTSSANGCTNTNKVLVNVNPLPLAPATTTSYTYCQGVTATTLTATAASGNTLRWYTVATGGTPLASAPTPSTSITGTTTYYVSQLITATGCEGPRTAITITVNPTPSAPVVTSPVNLCLGGSASALTATKSSPTDTIMWYTAPSGGTGSTTAPVPSTATIGSTNYYPSLKTNLGCEGSRATITVNVNPLPVAPLVTTPVTYCQNATATALSATGTNLKWYTVATGGTASTTAPVPSTATAGTFTYYVSQSSDPSSGSCEGPRAAITVTINPTPVAPVVTTPVTYCLNATASALVATKALTADTLLWYTAATGGTGSSATPTPSTATAGTTTYYVSEKTPLGCEGPRASIVVTVNALPAAPTVTTPVNLCIGGPSSALTATGTNIKWYTVATGGTSSSTAPTPTTATVGTTVYYVSQTSSTTGCESQRSAISVIVNDLPAAPVVASPLNLCVGGSSSALTATGTTLKWYTAATGGTGSTTAPTPSTASVGSTNYYVSQTSSVGCEGTRATLTVVVNALPAAPTVVTPVNLCIDVIPGALTATGSNLKWYVAPTGGVGNTTAPVPSTTTLGTTTYYVSQTSSVGCEGNRSSISVIVNPSPTLTITPVGVPDFVFCDSRTVTLKANTDIGTSFQWFKTGVNIPGETNDSLKAGTKAYYGVTVSSVYGCIRKDSVLVKDNPLPMPTLSPTDVQICQGVDIVLYAKPVVPTYTYEWFYNGNPMLLPPTTDNTPVSADGAYYVTVTDYYTCVRNTNFSIVSNYPALIRPVIVRMDPVLKLNRSYAKYQWYRNYKQIPGATSSTYTMSFDGIYYAEVTDNNDCFTVSDTVEVAQLSVKNLASDASVKIYPNPSTGTVHIDAPFAVNVTVLDMVGKEVLSAQKAASVDLTRLSDGVYFFRVFNEEGTLIGVEKINKISNQ